MFVKSRLFCFRKVDPTRSARLWSNKVLKSFSQQVTGSVINVSAWNDEDKGGLHYRQYFPKATDYTISNFPGWRGKDSISDVAIDLEGELEADLLGRFSFVFNHTTLEHIYDVRKAVANLCKLSSNAVFVVVPFAQYLHGPEDADFWRISPYALRRMFLESGFSEVMCTAGPSGNSVKYICYLASKLSKNVQSPTDCTGVDWEKLLRDNHTY